MAVTFGSVTNVEGPDDLKKHLTCSKLRRFRFISPFLFLEMRGTSDDPRSIPPYGIDFQGIRLAIGVWRCGDLAA